MYGEQNIRIEQVEENLSIFAGEMMTSVRYDNLRETVQLKDMIDKDFGILYGYDLFTTSNGMQHLDQYIHKDHNSREAVRLW